LSAELNSGNLGSQCEAVIVVLQGLMSSEGGTSTGCVTGCVAGSELAEISHMSAMGHHMSYSQLTRNGGEGGCIGG